MPTRTASAVWEGGLRDGKGTMSMKSGASQGAYSFGSRFEQNPGTNPEELLAASHAGCYSMALSAGLERAGFKPNRVSTTANVTLSQVEGGFGITKIELQTEAEVPGIDEQQFQEIAEATKKTCPISRALAAVDEIVVKAKRVG